MPFLEHLLDLVQTVLVLNQKDGIGMSRICEPILDDTVGPQDTAMISSACVFGRFSQPAGCEAGTEVHDELSCQAFVALLVALGVENVDREVESLRYDELDLAERIELDRLLGLEENEVRANCKLHCLEPQHLVGLVQFVKFLTLLADLAAQLPDKLLKSPYRICLFHVLS